MFSFVCLLDRKKIKIIFNKTNKQTKQQQNNNQRCQAPRNKAPRLPPPRRSQLHATSAKSGRRWRSSAEATTSDLQVVAALPPRQQQDLAAAAAPARNPRHVGSGLARASASVMRRQSPRCRRWRRHWSLVTTSRCQQSTLLLTWRRRHWRQRQRHSSRLLSQAVSCHRSDQCPRRPAL